MADIPIPSWLSTYVAYWADKLYLQPWTIKLLIAESVNHDQHTMAMCNHSANVFEATITFRTDVEENQEWQEIAIHELLHIAHSGVDQVVQDHVFPQLGPSAREVANQQYIDTTEKCIHLLAKVLWERDRKGAINAPPGLSTNHSRPEPEAATNGGISA